MITVITPTRNRAECFGLLRRCMSLQTIKESIYWIVVNDGPRLYPIPDRGLLKSASGCFIVTQQLHRVPAPNEGHSLPANILAALRHIKQDSNPGLPKSQLFFIWEDDDWYHPRYLEEGVKIFDDPKIMLGGFGPSLYYNVRRRNYKALANKFRHASLAVTGFRRPYIPFLKKVCSHKERYVDLRAWRWYKHPAKKRIVDQRKLRTDKDPRMLYVGIKGMPGEPGIGTGHKMKKTARKDPDQSKLRSWIGDDVSIYTHYYDPGV